MMNKLDFYLFKFSDLLKKNIDVVKINLFAITIIIITLILRIVTDSEILVMLNIFFTDVFVIYLFINEYIYSRIEQFKAIAEQESQRVTK